MEDLEGWRRRMSARGVRIRRKTATGRRACGAEVPPVGMVIPELGGVDPGAGTVKVWETVPESAVRTISWLPGAKSAGGVHVKTTCPA